MTSQLDLWHYHLMHIASDSVKAILDGLEDGNKSAMARKCKLPQPTLSRIANGRVTPSLEVLQVVASAYGFKVRQLRVQNFDPKNPPMLRSMSKSEEDLYLKIKELGRSLSNLS